MHEVASGAELAVFVLVVVSAHLLSQNGLVLNKFPHPMREETVGSIGAVPCLIIALAELQFSLLRQMGCSFIIYQIDTHSQ